MPELSIIVLSYNSKDLPISCIKSINQQYQKELEIGKIEIILVDNGSNPNILNEIKEYLKKIKNLKIIENKENLGFSKGNNIGVKNAKGEYLLFLNSDTEVKNKRFLEMIDFLEKHQEVGILGGRLKNPNGTNQLSAGKFYDLKNTLLMLLGLEKLGLLRFCPNNESKVDWVSGACMMINKRLFDKIGGFDENFFMYIEDMEICFRMKKNGFCTYYYPATEILHNELGSSNRSFAVVSIYKGLLYFYKKHKSNLEYNIVKTSLILKAYVLVSFGFLTKNDYLSQTYKKALNF